ncbi:Lysophospholipase, alpha-beta hydrolase superfamily [Paenibacillus sp. UNCCL117]|uniref:alpha/beta hydrolase n=1 Tax=unclassified Paenibacillus TaxID=185978 RepID=UPI000882A392|nr:MULTISPECIES: alpha/beta hydrolase [unclassified Paenibacillus]SDC06285.1 Lysophospholipase, alpha-beta hydrolase superfamily [Paenibacillus sp. cl123]SFW37785.1 Lysophospholipase, alpha-beta hydrolase superfamily [Paenibacillus sp. UNCCL117]
MRNDHFTFEDPDGIRIYVYRWLPDAGVPVKAVVQISHGLAETAARYAELAAKLTAAGYAVYAHDHRGHGRTAGTPEQVTVIGTNGFDRMTEAVAILIGRIRSAYPELPVFLLGHSMGSFVVMQAMYRYPGLADGIMLSGTMGPQPIAHAAGWLLAGLLMLTQGPDRRSKLLNSLSTGAFNKPFRPNRTPVDWLSRDEAEVDKYMEDPFCGGAATNGLWFYTLKGLLGNHKPAHLRRIPKTLPLFAFAGDQDPLGLQGKSFLALMRQYRRLGMTGVTYKLYEGGRHEMLHETNRDEVMQDVLDWLDVQVRKFSENKNNEG